MKKSETIANRLVLKYLILESDNLIYAYISLNEINIKFFTHSYK